MTRPGALVLALLLAGCAARGPADRLTPVAVRHGPFAAAVLATATVKPLDAVGLTLPPGLNGGSLATLAPEGSHVRKGAVVARIAQRRLIEQYADAQDAMADQDRETTREKAERKVKALEIDQEVLEKRRTWRAAELKAAQARRGGTPDFRAEARRARELAALAIADSPAAKERALYDLGAVPKAELDRAELDERLSRIDRERAVLLMAKLAPGGDANAVAEAGARAGMAKARYQAIVLEAPARKKLLEAESQKRKVAGRGGEKTLKKLTARMAAATMTTPVDGVVLYPLIWGWRPAHVGMQVWNGLTFMQVARLDAMRLEGAVGERDVAGVKVGAAVEITADGYPGRIFPGTVESVGRLAKETASNEEGGEGREPQARRFDLAVRPLGPVPVPELRPNMHVKLRILGERREDASIVPKEALFGDGGKFIWLATPAGPKKQAVTVDLEGRDWVALSTPLAADAKVYLLDPTTFGAAAP